MTPLQDRIGFACRHLLLLASVLVFVLGPTAKSTLAVEQVPQPKGSPTAPSPPQAITRPPLPVEQPPRPVQNPGQFTNEPNTPLKDLLPEPPERMHPPDPLVEDLEAVPEVLLQKPLPRNASNSRATEHIALTIARIKHLNQEKPDGFWESLRATRSDLRGLPVLLGESSGLTSDGRQAFSDVAFTVRRSLALAVRGANPRLIQQQSEEVIASAFWKEFAHNDSRLETSPHRAPTERVSQLLIGALMQELAPESVALRLGLIKYLATAPHADASRALARLTLFSEEPKVRYAALRALEGRPPRQYRSILLYGLRYPLPEVARRAGEAIRKLKNTNVLPDLVDLLDEPDPRAPVFKQVGNQRVPTIREVVRINHHKNCLLCHAPAERADRGSRLLAAPVPLPTRPLPTAIYYDPSSDLLVRFDVTYLRQDFSRKLAVADAKPWPEMQRFDFLVRTRILTEKELSIYQETMSKQKAGGLSLYHQVILAALRELTRGNAAPTSQAWRQVLQLPAPEDRNSWFRQATRSVLAYWLADE